MLKKYFSSINTQSFSSSNSTIGYYLKFWKWFVLSIFACLCVAFIYIKFKAPIYNMRASIVVRSEESSSKGKMESALMNAVGIGGLSSSSSNIDDEIGVINSHSIMRKMISDLDLCTSYSLKKFPFNKSIYNSSPINVKYNKYLTDTLSGHIAMKLHVGKDGLVNVEMKYNKNEVNGFSISQFPQTLTTDCGTFTFEKNKEAEALLKDKEYTLLAGITGLDLAAENYKNSIDISPASKRSNIIILSVNDTERQRGKDILDKLIELYNKDALSDKNKAAQSSIEFITERTKYIYDDLEKIEQDVELYKRNNNLTDIESEAKIFLETMSTVREKTVELEIQSNILQMIESHLKDPVNKYALIPSSLGLPESLLKVIEQYNMLILERNKMLRNANESNPTILTINEQIDLMRQNVFLSIEQAKKETQITRKDWQKRENEMQSRMKQMPTQERAYLDMQRQQLIKSELYVFLLGKLQEAELTLASNTPKAKIIDSAYNIFKPVAPVKPKTYLIALALGLVLPIATIYMMKILRFKLSSKEELTESTTLPVLGEICFDKRKERVVVKEGANQPAVELFRLLRTNLQFLLKKDEKVVLLTSSISGEGKSFVALNLALSFSLIKNKRVVIVGLDIRNPKLSEYLSVDAKNGITNFLSTDDYSPKDIIVPLSNLSSSIDFIPSGPIPPNPSELLLSDKLEELFDYLRNNYDFILVDTAPVGMVSDTFSLNKFSDLTVYLYRANYTNKSYLRLAESAAEEEKLKNLYLVMNGTTTKDSYGYGYGQANTH
ncbi:tyrosine-protein kinase [Dysgonomonas sp. 520]|uniref:GumC family protein n=1 Tax=Dysgonomonas sp. 520 TaxID=2302931 RepID=UPI0013D6854E|nr:tyrosine-protein kinase [Dysgonomonas sp. 520]NDW10596.1 polysaccharide biosynthesis tyrosine autokinase [Dysgonomonas sp. 520]